MGLLDACGRARSDGNDRQGARSRARARARRRRDLAPGSAERARAGGLGRRRRLGCRRSACRARRRRRRLSPRPFARRTRLRRARPSRGRRRRPGECGRGSDADRVSRRARRRLDVALAAPPESRRDGHAPSARRRSRHEARRRDDRRPGKRRVRDRSRSRPSPARDDLSALGLRRDPTGGNRGRRALSRRCRRPRTCLRAEARRRRPGGDDVPRTDGASRRRARAEAGDRRGAISHAAAVVPLAAAGDPGSGRRGTAARRGASLPDTRTGRSDPRVAPVRPDAVRHRGPSALAA